VDLGLGLDSGQLSTRRCHLPGLRYVTEDETRLYEPASQAQRAVGARSRREETSAEQLISDIIAHIGDRP